MKRPYIVSVVVCTLSFLVIIYGMTLAICALYGIEPTDKVLDHLKDAGIYALGAISALLVKTSEAPTETTIVNTPEQPVPTDPQT